MVYKLRMFFDVIAFCFQKQQSDKLMEVLLSDSIDRVLLTILTVTV